MLRRNCKKCGRKFQCKDEEVDYCKVCRPTTKVERPKTSLSKMTLHEVASMASDYHMSYGQFVRKFS